MEKDIQHVISELFSNVIHSEKPSLEQEIHVENFIPQNTEKKSFLFTTSGLFIILRDPFM